jgi:hypothetical protein
MNVRTLPADDQALFELAAIDAEFLQEYGPQKHWMRLQRDQYEAATAAVFSRLAARQVA